MRIIKEYYVTIDTDDLGFHEIHTKDCHRAGSDKKYLGSYNNASDAVIVARRIYDNCESCKFCSKEAHQE